MPEVKKKNLYHIKRKTHIGSALHGVARLVSLKVARLREEKIKLFK